MQYSIMLTRLVNWSLIASIVLCVMVASTEAQEVPVSTGTVQTGASGSTTAGTTTTSNASTASTTGETVTVDLGTTEPDIAPPIDEEYVEVIKNTVRRNYVMRGLTMPRMTLRADLSFTIFNTSPVDWANEFSTNFMMQVGGSFSITDDLEVGISAWRLGSTRFPAAFREFPPATLSGLVGIRFTNGIDFGDIPLWGRYRVLNKEKVQLAIELGLQIPTNTRFGLWLAMPVRITPSDSIAIDTGVEFGFNVNPFKSTLNIPVAANFQIIDGLYAGLKTGIGFYDFAEMYIPLGAQVGYTLGATEANNPLLDLELAFLWPNFIATGNTDTIQATWWSLGLNARFYYTL